MREPTTFSTQSQTHNMPLLSLPPELLIHILSSIPSRNTLIALATTCRRLYAVFLDNRTTLIYAALRAELGASLPEALAFTAILALDVDAKDYLVRLGEVLETYKQDLWGDGGEGERMVGPAPQRMEEEFVKEMSKAHRDVSCVAGVYAECAVLLLECEVKPGCEDAAQAERVAAPLSEVERARILKAHYRLALQKNLERWTYYWLRCDPGAYRFLHFGLVGQWEAWEVQQVLSATQFVDSVLTPRLADDADLGDAIEECRDWLPIPLTWDGLATIREFVEQLRELDEDAWQEVVRRSSSFQNGLDKDPWRVVRRSLRLDRPWHLRYDESCRHAFELRSASVAMWDSPRVEAMKTSSTLQHCKTGWARRAPVRWGPRYY